MKYFFGFAFCFLLSDSLAQSTCSPQISTQEDIDNFSSNYPSCTTLTGNLRIVDSSIINLNGLSQLTEVTGIIDIRGDNVLSLQGLNNVTKTRQLYLQNSPIESLDGLQSLEEVQEDFIISNLKIKSLQGLDKLERLNKGLRISDCEEFISIEGMPKLSLLNGFGINDCPLISDLLGFPEGIEVGQSLNIANCESLNSLVGLEVLEGNVNGVFIRENENLISLLGLSNLVINSSLWIKENKRLSRIEGVHLVDTIYGNVSIESNDSLVSIEELYGVEYIDDVLIRGNKSLKNFNGLESIKSIESLSIEDNDEIIDLEGFNSLIRLDFLGLKSNDSLKSLHGLENVDTINRLALSLNHELLNFEGLNSLKYCRRGISIISNNELVSLDGLDSVSFSGCLLLLDNDKLKNVNGLRNLKSLDGQLHIESQDSLYDISGLSGIDPHTIHYNEGTGFGNHDITILRNRKLSICSITSICNKIAQPESSIKISNNGEGCSDKEEVEEQCKNKLGLTGYIYEDKNDNGQYDEGDLPVANCKVAIALNSSTEVSDYTDNEGYYRIFVERGEYPLSYGKDERCYDPLLVDTTIVIVESVLTVQDYPYVRNATGELLPPEGFNIHLSRAATRCGFTVRHHVSVVNNTCLDSRGTLLYMIDGLVDSIFNISNPSAILTDQSITLSIGETLLPGQSFDFTFDAIMPGPEAINTFINDSIIFDYTFESNPNLNGSTTQTFSSEIRCAYDPNDKLAQPDRSDQYDKAYLLDEAIVYTIRFQNTGNDTAFVVRLEDEISPLLNISTLKPVQASHDYQLKIDAENRLLTILFEDILLPDSTTNLIGANGFFSFTIMPVEDLDDFTTIENNADIYFDFNPPIRTNTFELTYVHDLSILISTNDIPKSRVKIYPNPAFDKIIIPDLDYDEYQIYNLNGRLIQKGPAVDEINISKLSPSLYMIVFKNKTGELIGRAKMSKR